MSEELSTPRQSKKTRLGRGLGSLLGEHNSGQFEASEPSVPAATPQKMVSAEPHPRPQETIAPGDKVHRLPVEWVYPNPDQPRRYFDPEALQELSDSILEKGILQPIVARKHSENKFEIISGERRWRAAQLAGLEKVPVLLREVDARESLELALIENIQRENLNPIEEAEAYLRLIEDFSLTQQQISEKVSKERATIANSLRLLNLPKEVRELVAQGSLTSGHAKVLLSVPDPVLMKKLALKVCSEKLTVRALEKFVAKGSGEAAQAEVAKVERTDDEILAEMLAESSAEELQKLLGTKVVLGYSGGKGQLSIHFYSDEEFNQIVEKIKAAWQK